MLADINDNEYLNAEGMSNEEAELELDSEEAYLEPDSEENLEFIDEVEQHDVQQHTDIEAIEQGLRNSNARRHNPQSSNADELVPKSGVSDLPITVTVHVGSFAMTMSQIENLKPNDLIAVEPSYQNKVSLRVDGCEIGVGQIVSLNGEVSIQIMKLWS